MVSILWISNYTSFAFIQVEIIGKHDKERLFAVKVSKSLTMPAPSIKICNISNMSDLQILHMRRICIFSSQQVLNISVQMWSITHYYISLRYKKSKCLNKMLNLSHSSDSKDYMNQVTRDKIMVCGISVTNKIAGSLILILIPMKVENVRNS